MGSAEAAAAVLPALLATRPARFADSSHSAAAATFEFEEQMPRNERDFPSPMCASALARTRPRAHSRRNVLVAGSSYFLLKVWNLGRNALKFRVRIFGRLVTTTTKRAAVYLGIFLCTELKYRAS